MDKIHSDISNSALSRQRTDESSPERPIKSIESSGYFPPSKILCCFESRTIVMKSATYSLTQLFRCANRFMYLLPSRALDEDVPVIPVSQILNLYEKRPKRQTRLRPVDEHPAQPYGDPIIQKHPESIRLFFQNSKGLTYTNTGEDYGYYMSCLVAYQVNIFGIAETNTCWSHHHLMAEFKHHARKHFRQNCIAFGSPSRTVDPCTERETFQSGGSVTVASGRTSSCSEGDTLSDPTGLGRWSGLTFEGKGDTKVSIITAYRSCSGSIASSPLGSTYAREYEFFKRKGIKSPNPRGQLLTDLDEFLVDLWDGNTDHSIILMMDANAVLEEDKKFQELILRLRRIMVQKIDAKIISSAWSKFFMG